MLRSGQPKLYYDRRNTKNFLHHCNFCHFYTLPSSKCGGGGPPLPPTFTFLPPSLSLLPLPSVSFSLPLLPSPPSPYLPILPLYPFFSTLSLLPPHPLSLPPPTHSLPPSLKSSPLPPLKHDEDDASGLTLPPSRVRHVICGMHNEIAITITM